MSFPDLLQRGFAAFHLPSIASSFPSFPPLSSLSILSWPISPRPFGYRKRIERSFIDNRLSIDLLDHELPSPDAPVDREPRYPLAGRCLENRQNRSLRRHGARKPS